VKYQARLAVFCGCVAIALTANACDTSEQGPSPRDGGEDAATADGSTASPDSSMDGADDPDVDIDAGEGGGDGDGDSQVSGDMDASEQHSPGGDGDGDGDGDGHSNSSGLTIGGCRAGGTDCDGAGGDMEFVALDDGANLSLVNGPQGAWMLVFLLRAEGIFPGYADDPVNSDNPRLTLVLLVDGTDEVLARNNSRAPFHEVGGRLQTVSGVFMILDGVDKITQARGTLLRVEATLTDRDGVVLEASQRVIGR